MMCVSVRRRRGRRKNVGGLQKSDGAGRENEFCRKKKRLKRERER